jgi:alginate O-acetyltransferase complex protein AlgI
MQIYFDFSGYCDMAIGIGKMFNINIPINFNSPYKSQSITEFWRRWHITLGRALKTYVYIPLGGNRRGMTRTYLNLFVTFCISGLWHGASWTFVLWGILHGAFIVAERLTGKLLDRVNKYVKIGCTFLIVNFLWVFFRASDMKSSILMLKAMVDLRNLDFLKVAKLANDGLVGFPPLLWCVYTIAILLLLLLVAFFTKNTIERSLCYKHSLGSAVMISGLFVVSVIHLSRLSVFIYFNF